MKQSFGWKRKIGQQVSKTASKAFENESAAEEDHREDIDWLTATKIPKRSTVISLEDTAAKVSRLVKEGTTLADAERYWEALKKWDEGLQYAPCDEKIHEMKAQALMELSELYPAVQEARKAVESCPTWWVAHQTLGRALLGLGEVRMAVLSFSRAVHLNPGDKELWEEDLDWAFSLLKKHRKIEQQKRQELEQKSNGVKIVELENVAQASSAVIPFKGNLTEHKSLPDNDKCFDNIKRLPTNYVQMRDALPP